jgi:hypothetical protein
MYVLYKLEKYLGVLETWEEAEKTLMDALKFLVAISIYVVEILLHDCLSFLYNLQFANSRFSRELTFYSRILINLQLIYLSREQEAVASIFIKGLKTSHVNFKDVRSGI